MHAHERYGFTHCSYSPRLHSHRTIKSRIPYVLGWRSLKFTHSSSTRISLCSESSDVSLRETPPARTRAFGCSSGSDRVVDVVVGKPIASGENVVTLTALAVYSKPADWWTCTLDGKRARAPPLARLLLADRIHTRRRRTKAIAKAQAQAMMMVRRIAGP